MTPRSDAAPHQTTYSTPTDRELVITRTFDAPRALVWAAFTDPKHVPHWYVGPEGFTMPVCEMDLRVGGRWRYKWRNSKGHEFEATGTYSEVDPPDRFAFVAKSPSGEENIHTTTFTEQDGRTTVTVRQLFASKASRDQGLPYAKMGTDPNHARLDAYLASLR